jgi:glycosyltransferase involved in cell wall biosynthesis
MKILVVHNYYQRPGGEDRVFATESALLEDAGHTVVRYTCHNDDLKRQSRLAMVLNTLWNRSQFSLLRRKFREGRFAVAHFHNTFPIISPAAYYAADSEGIPVVQTLHNYRLHCLNGQFFRGGGHCELCLGRRLAWSGLVHACYRGSVAASAVVAATQALHRLLATWTRKVAVYIALTEFARQKFVEGGLPAEKIVVKPNFIHPDPGPGTGEGGYALFVGRLAPEKGVETLLAASRLLGRRLPLKIVGDGPLAPAVESFGREQGAVEWLGWRPVEEVYRLMGAARCLIFPSLWVEGMPMTILESFARGTPVIASDLGSMASMIEHGRTGFRFRPGDPGSLAERLEWVMGHPAELHAMRSDVRAEFESKYTAQTNYQQLIDIYRKAGCSAAALARMG